MEGHVTVKFNKSYIAARGPGIAGAKGDEKHYRMTTDLKLLIDDETVSVVKSAPAAKRETATKKK